MKLGLSVYKTYINLGIKIGMKTNFKKIQSDDNIEKKVETNTLKDTDLSQEEFEKYVIESGAKGSFMVYRSKNKDDELGIDEL